MVKHALMRESKEKLEVYIGRGFLSKSDLAGLFGADDCQKMVEALGNLISINEEQKTRIWMFVVQKVFRYAKRGEQYSEEDEISNSVLSQQELIILKELLNNGGILQKTKCVEKGIFENENKGKKAIDALEEREILDCYRLSNKKMVYLLNMNFYRETMGGTI